MIPIIAALVLASGFFSLFEESLHAVRMPKLQKEADDAEARAMGRARAAGYRRRAQRYRRVIQAAESPDRYFAAAHFWIVCLQALAAVIAGLGVERLPLLQSAALPLFATALVCTAAFVPAALLFGSLFPRLIARRAPEAVAAAALPLIEACALPLRPFYALMQAAGRRLEPVLPPAGQPGMTEHELHLALAEGEKSGIVESKEKTMVEGVFYLGDRPLGAFMTHRSSIKWIDINSPALDIRAKIYEYRAQRCFPVADGTLDNIIGAAYSEDIIFELASKSGGGLRSSIKKALFAPETMPALKAFESFKQGKADFLFVMDEYGGFAGMVGIHDLIEEITGEVVSPAREEEQAVLQEDDSWLAGGSMNIDDAAELFSLPGLAAVSDDYHTLAGFVLSLAGELPRVGDTFAYQGRSFTVLEMDGNRIEKIKVGAAELI